MILVVGIAALATSALADSPCQLALPTPPPTDMAHVPAPLVLRAIVPTIDAKGHAPIETHGEHGGIASCRGDLVASDWDDSRVKRGPGTVLLGARDTLPDGRQAVWIYTALSAGAPATTVYGFLAIVRLDAAANRLVVDAVGKWDNGEDAARKLDAVLFAPRGFVEPTGHTGTGGGDDSYGRRVWVVTAAGELIKAGQYDVWGFDDNLGAESEGQPYWTYRYTSAVQAKGPVVHVTDHQTWTLSSDDKIQVKSLLNRWYVLDGNKLREGSGLKAKAPPLPKPAPAHAPQN